MLHLKIRIRERNIFCSHCIWRQRLERMSNILENSKNRIFQSTPRQNRNLSTNDTWSLCVVSSSQICRAQETIPDLSPLFRAPYLTIGQTNLSCFRRGLKGNRKSTFIMRAGNAISSRLFDSQTPIFQPLFKISWDFVACLASPFVG